MASSGNWSSSSGSSSSTQAQHRHGNAAASNTTGAQDEHLIVAIRVRPAAENAERCIDVISNKALLYDDGIRNRTRKYSYDYVFNETDTQEMVYKTTTAPLIQEVLKGNNAAVFAYGATGSGKTHTMLGPCRRKSSTASSSGGNPHSADQHQLNGGYENGNGANSNDSGLMTRAIEDIFQHTEEMKDINSYKISISYLEIYNELIRDLLNPGGPLELREDNRGQRITVAGLSEVTTSSCKEVISLLMRGNKARTMEPTAANQTSSRSHALLSITVQIQTPLGFKQGRLFLTDLAGSERARKTKNRGKRLQEGAHINRSLLALGNCINALSGGARYVNYRDSKLTRLLKEALSGRCKTVMIAHIAPESKHCDETKNTLIYADRANSIKTRHQNSVYLDEMHNFTTKHYQHLVNELRDEVLRLRSKMYTERPRSASVNDLDRLKDREESQETLVDSRMPLVVNDGEEDIDNDVERELEDIEGCDEEDEDEKRKAELRYLREEIIVTFKQQMKLRRKLLDVESQILRLEFDAERYHTIIAHWQGRLGKLYGSPTYKDDMELENSSMVRNAWEELMLIGKERKRFKEIRYRTEQALELCRQRGVQLENELPGRISCDEERELLALLCRVHELEADKVSLQAERLAKHAELRRRDMQLLKAERGQRLCEDIISLQRRLLEEANIEMPEDLHELYALYQQELHASTAITSALMEAERKLPPIYTAGSDTSSSSGGSGDGGDWSPPPPLPPIPSTGSVSQLEQIDEQPRSQPSLDQHRSSRLPKLPSFHGLPNKKYVAHWEKSAMNT